MGAVDLARQSAASLEAAGVVLEWSLSGAVSVRAPKSLGPVVRDAVAWRVEAMTAQGMREGLRGRALVAVEGVVAAVGLCASCGDLHAAWWRSGDCALCNAARVKVLREAKVLGGRA